MKRRHLPRVLALALLPLALPALGGCDSKPKAGAAPEASHVGPSESAAVRTSPTSDVKLLVEGSSVPKIETVAHDGESVSFEKLKGKPIVLYFYPKDDTPGCTVEAQQIRDSHDDLSKTGAVVLGVSGDSNESHSAFAKKHSLPFKLLPDTDHVIASAFGVPVKNGYAARVTFIIDKEGKIAKVFPVVKPDGHAKEILAELQKLSQG